MPDEGLTIDWKSIRYVLGRHRDAHQLSKDCVAFANAIGGRIVLGIEDPDNDPPADQRVRDDLADELHKRLTQITVNVGLTARRQTAPNGGQFIVIDVCPSAQSIASTSDGRYFIRVSDETRPLMPDDLGRLLAEKNTLVWELQTTRKVRTTRADSTKRDLFLRQVRASDRVSDFAKRKTDLEILEHYFLVSDGYLTNLGVLWIGQRIDRAALLYPPTIQYIKFDERGQKVRKIVWDEYDMNPLDLIEEVWRKVPEWSESYEIPDGVFRKTVPHYDEVVVRELLANALVHRPYTQRGDIFLNLFPDRLEVHNPGLLPIGVTPTNILHASSKRNPHLAKVFYDLKMMEGEGSGFDRIYEVLLASGKPVPEVRQGDDRVVVTVQKRIIDPCIVDFLVNADDLFQLSQKERITLGVISQNETVTAAELLKTLELKDMETLHRDWLGRLLKTGLVRGAGLTRGKRYLVEPEMLRKLDFGGATTLKNIETHRLRELILRDLDIHGKSGISAIHSRIGSEIPRRRLQTALKDLVNERRVEKQGGRRFTIYLAKTG